VYFARSIEGTIGKAKSSGGATIIAEIRMGKVYEVDRDHIANNHPNFKKEIYEDEFAIRNANKQIVKWVMVIDQQFDSKVEDYGLITEFDSTKCFCI
ncbi:unnamed protein product, partial [Rotaria sordida]